MKKTTLIVLSLLFIIVPLGFYKYIETPSVNFNDNEMVTGYEDRSSIIKTWKDVKKVYEQNNWKYTRSSPNDGIPLAPFVVYKINDFYFQSFDERWKMSGAEWYMYHGKRKWRSVK